MLIEVDIINQQCDNCCSKEYEHVSDGITDRIVLVDLRCNQCGVLNHLETDISMEDYINSGGILVSVN